MNLSCVAIGVSNKEDTREGDVGIGLTYCARGPPKPIKKPTRIMQDNSGCKIDCRRSRSTAQDLLTDDNEEITHAG